MPTCPPARSCSRSRCGAAAEAADQLNAELLDDVRFGEFEQFSFTGANGDTVHGYVMKPWNATAGREISGRLPGPRRPAGQLRQRLELPLESADLRRRRLCGRVHRLPRLDRLRPEVHRRDQRRLGRQAAGRPAKRPGRRGEEVPVAGPRTQLRAGRLLRRLHDELDRGQLVERFKCLVNHDGVFDTRGMAYSTEELWFTEWENGGTYFAAPAAAREASTRSTT